MSEIVVFQLDWFQFSVLAVVILVSGFRFEMIRELKRVADSLEAVKK